MDFNFQFGIGIACLFLKYNLQTIFFMNGNLGFLKPLVWISFFYPYLYARSLYNYESLCTCVVVIGVAFWFGHLAIFPITYMFLLEGFKQSFSSIDELLSNVIANSLPTNIACTIEIIWMTVVTFYTSMRIEVFWGNLIQLFSSNPSNWNNNINIL